MRADILVPQAAGRDTAAVYCPTIPRGALEAAAALTARGWMCEVFDGYSFPQVITDYLTRFGESDADLVGISVHAAPSLEPAIDLALRLREIRPELPLIFGGNLARVAPEILSRYIPERSSIVADSAVCGAVAKMLVGYASTGTKEIPRNESGFGRLNFDVLRPEFSTYALDSDFEYALPTQDGCPYRCFHCGTGRPGLLGRVKYRDPIDIEHELISLRATAKACGTEQITLWVTDETFISDLSHVEAVLDAFRRSGPWRWRAQSRLDAAPQEVLRRMARAGCYKIAFGIEIPSDDGLTALGKREAMDAARRAFGDARAAGLEAEAILVVGVPESQISMQALFDELNALGATSVQAYIYHPVPGSPWWKRHGYSAVEPLDSWSALDFHKPPVTITGQAAKLAVGRYLALQLWPAEGTVHDAPSINVEGQSSCACGSGVTLSVLEQADTVVSFELTHDTRVFLGATDYAGDTLLLYPYDGSNIHASMRHLSLSSSTIAIAEMVCPNAERRELFESAAVR